MQYSIKTCSVLVSSVFDVYDPYNKLVVAGVTEIQATQLILYLKNKDQCNQDFELSLAY
jgi:hypothetical protein